jgi:hypothetical protein
MVYYEKETIPGDKNRHYHAAAGSWQICQRHCEGTRDQRSYLLQLAGEVRRDAEQMIPSYMNVIF